MSKEDAAQIPVDRFGNRSAFLTAPAGLYAMMTSSPLEKHERHSPDYLCTGEKTVQS